MTHSPSSAQSNEMKLSITPTQIQALYLLLLRRHRPEFGWMEEPLVAIEAALKPAHDAIHDRSFNAMNRQFFGDDRFHLDEAPMPAQLEARAAASAHTIGEDAANGAMGEREAFEAWAKTSDGNCNDRDLERRHDGDYRNMLVQRDWEVWQARAALTAEKVTGQAVDAKRMTEIARKWMKKGSGASPEFYWGDFYDCVREIIAAPQPSQPAQSGEHCVNCGASVDPLCACERGRKLAAQSAEQDERAAHCVNTCNFYNKNRPCECPAPQSDAAAWEAIFDRVALELNCLPSSSPDGNEHVFHAIAKLRAASTQSTATQPVQTERALTADELAEFERTVGDFEDDGETSTDYTLLLNWAQRGLLECTHFEVTKAGQAILAAQPASSLAEGDKHAD